MNKNVKLQILDIIDTFQEMHNEIINYLNLQSFEHVYVLLEECQQAAIDLGNQIEYSEGSACQVIKYIEEYCEYLYQVSLLLSFSNIDINNIKLDLDVHLNHVKEEVHDIKTKKEIVFMPYKASMWDSLESIWKSAIEDERFEVFVVPIPYYNKKDSRIIGDLKYEGDQFPDYVNVTLFNNYSPSIRKPDIIYIHNPYDQYNLVSSVHPAYYTSELKKYTQMLVYVPYFITGARMPEHFKLLPSYYHVDKIITQSELTSIYFDNLIKHKIIPLGSPKIDKIINMKNIFVQDSWLEKAQNKKVVLLNTSISGFLNHKEKYIKKIEYIINTMKDKKDVVLLWRPHPLLESTIMSIHSEMANAYRKLVEDFTSNNWGIFDTSTDISSTVAFSDAYLGEDSSSIAYLFAIMGKPIFILDYTLPIIKQRDYLESSLYFFDAYNDNGELYFTSAKSNALFQISLDKKYLNYINQIPNTLPNQTRLYNEIIKVDERFIFIPFYSKEVSVYNKISKEYVTIPISNPKEVNFTRGIHYNDTIYLIPAMHDSIVRLSLLDYSMEYIPYSNLIKNEQYNPNLFKFMHGVHCKDNKMILASAQSNHIIEINLSSMDVATYEVGGAGMNFWGMEFDGKNYWLITNDQKSIIKWNYENKSCLILRNFPEGFNGVTKCFYNIVNCDTYMLVFPKFSNMILKIDILTNEITEFKIGLPYNEGERYSNYYNWSSNYYMAKRISKNMILAITAYDDSMILINLDTLEYEKIPLNIAVNEIDKLLSVKDSFQCLNVDLPYACKESEYINIERIVDYIVTRLDHNFEKQISLYKDNYANIDGSCGYKIHHEITNLIV